MPEDITLGGLPGDTHVIASDPAGTVGSVTPSPAPVAELTLAELNQRLGKNFPSKEAALKSIEDTISYVGRKKEDIEREVLSRVATKDDHSAMAKQLEEMRRDMFYKDNPQYADPNTRALINQLGGNPVEVVSKPEFKAVFDKVKGYDDSQKLRTVLDSNPRLATTKDALTKARELQSSGGRQDAVEALVAEGVLAAFEQ